MNDSSADTPELASVVHEAHALLERRRFAQAKVVAARGLKHFPDNSELQYITAFAEYAEDDNDAAIKAVEQLLARDPEHYGARTLRAHLHSAKQEFAQAESLWIALLREYPEDADCYAAYADLMLRTLNLDKAARLAREGLRHSPEHHACLYVASLVDLIHGRGDASHLLRLLREHPEHTASSIALVAALTDRGEYRGALRLAQELLRNQPDSEHLVSLVRELKLQSHWTMLPLYPMQRWGWGGAAAVTVAGIVGLRLAGGVLPPALVASLSYTWLIYVIYSWTWPSILRKLI